MSVCGKVPTSSCVAAPVNEIATAHVDCQGAGKGELTATVSGIGNDVLSPVAVRDNGDDTYDVTYSVPNTGTYELAIKYDGEHIEGSPFTIDGYSKAYPEEVGKFSFVQFDFLNSGYICEDSFNNWYMHLNHAKRQSSFYTSWV